MTVTGERVTTGTGGFNPTWQRHVAAYKLCAPFLPAGRVLDIGAGIGHSFHLLAPRETVGVDLDGDALSSQDRETVVADMRELPFDAASVDGVVAVQSIEHVPDPERAVAEAARVLRLGGVAVYVTPNRLTFARPDEIVDPYHYVEFDAEQLSALCRRSFDHVDMHGIFGSERYLELVDEQKATLDELLARDPMRLRRFVPRRVRQILYDRMLTRARAIDDPRTAAITVEDFSLAVDRLSEALDVVAVCRRHR